jgi:hypothetical protein
LLRSGVAHPADEGFKEIAAAASARPKNEKPAATQRAFVAILENSGAGEGIRTLDPDLGKVVLYP